MGKWRGKGTKGPGCDSHLRGEGSLFCVHVCGRIHGYPPLGWDHEPRSLWWQQQETIECARGLSGGKWTRGHRWQGSMDPGCQQLWKLIRCVGVGVNVSVGLLAAIKQPAITAGGSGAGTGAAASSWG